MNTGTVKFFNAAKGFGFIVDDATNKDIFVHITGLAGGVNIQEKDKVQFEIEDGKKGPSAVKVSKI
jgi:CspA family cold shock protein